MKATEIIFGDLVIQINRKPIKHMYVKIKPPEGQIVVHVPMRAKSDWIQRILASKKEWLHTQQKRFQNPVNAPLILESGETIPFPGKEYCLQINENCKKNDVFCQDGYLHINLAPDADSVDKINLLNRWYKQQMHNMLPALIAKWEPVIGVKVNAFSIKLMKTRWGSCNTRTGKINLNLNLMKKPLLCIEYVLVHELIHLLEASHNRRFYELMHQFMPDWKTYQQLLEPGRHCNL